jgi:hypothetical protein
MVSFGTYADAIAKGTEIGPLMPENHDERIALRKARSGDPMNGNMALNPI